MQHRRPRDDEDVDAWIGLTSEEMAELEELVYPIFNPNSPDMSAPIVTELLEILDELQ